MNKITNNKRTWLKKRIIPILAVLLALAITAVLFVYRDKFAELGDYGYLGAFLVCLISNASIILPVPGIVVLFVLGATPGFNPVLVALAGAAGGTIGEVTGFIAGYGGRGMVQSRGRFYTTADKWMRRWGGWAIFAFAVFPLPIVDIAGVVAGILRYPLWKFLLIVWPGKSIKYIFLVLAGVWGWQALLRYFG